MLEGAEKCQSASKLMEEFDGHFISTLFEEKNDKKKVWNLLLLLIKSVLRFFSSFSNIFMKPQYDFRGLCM